MSTSSECGRRASRGCASASTPTTRSRCCRSGSTSTTTPAGRRSHTKYFYHRRTYFVPETRAAVCCVAGGAVHAAAEQRGVPGGPPQARPPQHRVLVQEHAGRAAQGRDQARRRGGQVSLGLHGLEASVSLDSNCPKNTDSSEEYSPMCVKRRLL